MRQVFLDPPLSIMKNRTKRQTSKWNSHVQTKTPTRNLSPKQLMHLEIKETPQSNGTQDLNGPSPTEDIEMAMKHMKRCSASVSIRAVDQKYNGASSYTGQKGHHRKSTTINAGEQMEEKNPPSCWPSGNPQRRTAQRSWKQSRKPQAQQSHSWAQVQGKPSLKKTGAPRCSWQYYVQ